MKQTLIVPPKILLASRRRALAVSGAVLSAGAVALPAEGLTYATDSPPSTPTPVERPLRLVVSRTPS